MLLSRHLKGLGGFKIIGHPVGVVTGFLGKRNVKEKENITVLAS